MLHKKYALVQGVFISEASSFYMWGDNVSFQDFPHPPE